MDKTIKDLKKTIQFDASYNKPNQFKAEGVDHLNISLVSGNPLGRILDPGYCLAIDYPDVGRFRSVLSLIYWLKSKDLDDKIRTLTGSKLNLYVKEKKLYNKKLANYTAILAYATWLKIKNRQDALDSIRKLPDNLELLSYRTNRVSGIRITTGFAPSIVPIVTEIIRAVKAGTEPDIEQFITHPEGVGKFYLEGILEKHLEQTSPVSSVLL